MSFPRTVAELRDLVGQGARVDYLLFYGHRPGPAGAVTKGCLSQWYEAPFDVDGVTYLTAEHFMMAGKARVFGDDDALRKILAAPDPGGAKALGRKVRRLDPAVWEAERSRIVVAGNLAKFSQHPPLGSFLRETGGRVLVEASPTDRVWGIGLAADSPAARDPWLWKGLNLLGFALMEVRDRL